MHPSTRPTKNDAELKRDVVDELRRARSVNEAEIGVAEALRSQVDVLADEDQLTVLG